ncbi:MAG TPA: glycosyltransferase family 2 protein [Clostridiales bacterium]|nr:glycosyltransferase family 2 protein [Clostridiales bacterium]HQP69068.1 glycosyltransferase family 2 protein [Clostridiales bacterium]
MNNKSVTLVIPAYNEEKAIAGSLSSIIQFMKENFSDFELIVVNDASTDNTASEVLKFSDVRLISHPYNKGNGAAVRTGIRNASRDFVVMMDADGQHDIKDIIGITDLLGEYDCVVGSRTESSEGSFHRNIANRLYNFLASYVTNMKIEDLTSGYRGFKTSVIKKYLYMFPNGFSYPTTSTLAVIKGGYNLKYFPIHAKKRIGKSKIRLLRDGFRFLLIIVKISILFSPLKIFLPVSVIFFLSGIFHMSYKMFLVTGGRYTQFSVFLISVSVIIFFIGLLSEQIATLRYDKVEED